VIPKRSSSFCTRKAAAAKWPECGAAYGSPLSFGTGNKATQKIGYRYLVPCEPNVRVEAKKRLPDKDTGQLREHDVVLTFSHGHHEFLLALECRDRSRPVGVDHVEAFHAKCLRTGIGRGVMVSSKGFRRTALRKAESYGIGCLTLEEVAHFDWALNLRWKWRASLCLEEIFK
jgi:hypothetical protein